MNIIYILLVTAKLWTPVGWQIIQLVGFKAPWRFFPLPAMLSSPQISFACLVHF